MSLVAVAAAAVLTISLDLLQLLAVLFDFVCLVERKQHDPVFVGGFCEKKNDFSVVDAVGAN